MTDDEISELAECLEDACRRCWLPVSALGVHKFDRTACCPMQALTGSFTDYRTVPGMTETECESFIRGFDMGEFRNGYDPRLYALGRQFAERYP